MKKIILIVFLIISDFIILPFKVYTLEETREDLKLYLGEPKIISISNPRRIVIGNPNIADVTNVTWHEITLTPKAEGSTTLVFWDNFGEQSYRIKVFAEDINEVKRRIDNLLERLNLPQVYTHAQEEEARIILLGKIKSSQDRERIISALGPLKEKIIDLIILKEEEAVVEIDVQVLELSKDATNTLGFTWPGSITLTESSGPTTTAVTGLKKIFHISDYTRSAFNITLDALVQEGKARILSRPRLACQSGKEAELLVGGEKPVLTTAVAATTGAQATAVEYKEFGIKLKIKPTVMEEGRIKLALNVEVSELGDTAIIIGSESQPTAKAFPLSKRTASTELFINDNQTMAIGGLVKQKTEEDIRKVPWLGDIPILGLLFRKKQTKIGGGQGTKGDTELFITLTPTIISEKKEVKEVKKEPIISSHSYATSEKRTDTPVREYAKLIQKLILENLTYPASAKEAGFQGTVKLGLHIYQNGELLEAKIKNPSGYKILDDNVLRIAQEISTYPPFPSSIEQEELWIDIPIVYQSD